METLPHVRPRLRTLFEAAREDPDAPLPNNEFMNALIKGGSDDIDSTWKGRRKKVQFLRHVEQEFSMCFTDVDMERVWSFDGFAERIAECMDQPLQCGRLARKRAHTETWSGFVLMVLVALSGLAASTLLPMPWGLLPVVVTFAVLLALFFVKFTRVRHYRTLADALLAED